MCGRYTLHFSKQKLAECIALEIPETFDPDYNIGPGREVLTIAKDRAAPKTAGMMHWGLKTPQNFHVNARLESADTAPRFRESWSDYRCLIPANGFYEWYQDGITKQPYYIFPTDAPLIYFAGLWFPSAFDGEPAACVVLTTEAHPTIRDIHDRMPVIVRPDAHEAWLDTTLKKQVLLDICGNSTWEKHAVSHRVNSVQNKDSRLIEATAAQTDDQMRLF